ncbi:MAG TPA: NAD(P)-dependent alcohol dehydrogenase [Kofleriaceae bacterium]|nr:NAD(P)-dependent alcohol dehydrogenase [Kofleriaceae bacterium]
MDMRTWHLTATGLDHLQLVERPNPEPGEHEIVVRVRAASINYRDTMIAASTFPPNRYPLVPLSDGAGDVVAVGRRVTTWRVGDRVTASFFADWTDGAQTRTRAATALGGAIDGVLTEAIALPAHGVIRTPAHLSDLEAATLPCAGLTAWHALFEGQDPVRPGHNVLLEGTGGVSVFGLQLAKLAGARAIVTSSSDAKLARARELGADVTINYAQNPEWQDAVREATDGEGVDHVLEIGGKETLGRALAATRYGGQVHLIGGVSGFAAELPLGPMAASGARVRRIYVGSVAMLQALARAVSVHRLRPVIDRTFGFAEAPAAIAAIKQGAHFGKLVIDFAR